MVLYTKKELLCSKRARNHPRFSKWLAPCYRAVRHQLAKQPQSEVKWKTDRASARTKKEPVAENTAQMHYTRLEEHKPEQKACG